MRILSAILMLVVIPSVAAEAHQEQAKGRLMPPVGLKCDRNNLTSYDGQILVYRRRTGRTFLRIRTNYDSTEDVTIRHPGTNDPSSFYLINGGRFSNSDWQRIERSKSILKRGMRANVWVCEGNPAIQPVVDWRPDDAGGSPRSR